MSWFLLGFSSQIDVLILRFRVRWCNLKVSGSISEVEPSLLRWNERLKRLNDGKDDHNSDLTSNSAGRKT